MTAAAANAAIEPLMNRAFLRRIVSRFRHCGLRVEEVKFRIRWRRTAVLNRRGKYGSVAGEEASNGGPTSLPGDVPGRVLAWITIDRTPFDHRIEEPFGHVLQIFVGFEFLAPLPWISE